MCVCVYVSCVYVSSQVEHVDGFMLTAFARPAAALQWALAVHTDMLKAPWPSAVLKHALGEEVCVPYVDNLGGSANKVVCQGFRVLVQRTLYACCPPDGRPSGYATARFSASQCALRRHSLLIIRSY